MIKNLLGKLKGLKGKQKGFLGAFAFALALAATAPKRVGAAPVEFTGVTLPFSVPDMLATATNFLVMYGEWILLALGVIFAPVLYGLAMKLVSAVKARSAAK